MFVGTWAAKTPDKPAIIRASTGEFLTYGELDARSMQLAQCFHAHGIRRGDRIAMFMENNIRFMEIVWATLRSGCEIISINRYATVDEAAYILNDSGAKAVVTSLARADIATGLAGASDACTLHLMCDGVVGNWASYEDALASYPPVPLDVEWMGEIMAYTSGTTGRPKGVAKPLSDLKISDEWPVARAFVDAYGFDQDMVYLSPAPLYHGAPIRFARAVQSVGGTVIMMEKFDALEALRLIERHRVTHSQWVPTMFVRMLQIPEADRAAIDLSTQRVAVHAAAPCPVDVKRRMISWWGPIIYEYYGATDGAVQTDITSEEWLQHPGSVGRAPRELHICNDDGDEVGANVIGLIYGEANGRISYLNDPAKTQKAQNPKNPDWMTTGDIGYVDEDGYLFLTGRRDFTIISGGVNIYPQAIEDALLNHPQIRDVAVLGVPSDTMGEDVKAVVELLDGVTPSADLAEDIRAFAGANVAAFMVPKSVDFVDQLPRLPTGKLYKQVLKEKYWGNSTRTPSRNTNA